MAWTQDELDSHLKSKGHRPTEHRSAGGHRIWLSAAGSYFWVPDWGGPYSDDTFDEIVRAIYRRPPMAERRT